MKAKDAQSCCVTHGIDLNLCERYFLDVQTEHCQILPHSRCYSMSLTAHQVSLVQDSFAKVEPIADKAAEIFYAKLFEYDPYLRPLFKGSMVAQGSKLMQTLKVAVAGLNNLSAIVPVLENLAVKHVGYGVRPQDYTTVGNALLYTLKTGLGDDFTDEVKKAWTDLFRLIAQVMKAKHDQTIGIK
jgi:hemoglobin-like flavoprotein